MKGNTKKHWLLEAVNASKAKKSTFYATVNVSQKVTQPDGSVSYEQKPMIFAEAGTTRSEATTNAQQWVKRLKREGCKVAGQPDVRLYQNYQNAHQPLMAKPDWFIRDEKGHKIITKFF